MISKSSGCEAAALLLLFLSVHDGDTETERREQRPLLEVVSWTTWTGIVWILPQKYFIYNKIKYMSYKMIHQRYLQFYYDLFIYFTSFYFWWLWCKSLLLWSPNWGYIFFQLFWFWVQEQSLEKHFGHFFDIIPDISLKYENVILGFTHYKKEELGGFFF